MRSGTFPGVETSSVYPLNLLQLAAGGHLGWFIIWMSSAFATLDKLYGLMTTPSAMKRDFLPPSNLVLDADIGRLINSSKIQAVLRAQKGMATTKCTGMQKKNPLKNRQVLLRINPYTAQYRKGKLEQEKGKRAREIFGQGLVD